MNDENLIFVSASNFGSYYDPDEDAYIWGLSVQEASTLAASLGKPVPVIKTDFVGINSNIYEPITASANTLGYPALEITTSGSSFSINYVNRAFVPGYVDARGLPHYNESTDPGRGAILNAIILHRQGPYGWPTWKQVRVGNHPINRAHRKNNIFSYAEKSSTNLTPYELAGAQPSSSPLTQELVAFNLTESCVSSKNKPLQHSFVVKQDGKLVNLNLKHSYGNLEEHYTNNKINIRLKFNGDFQDKFTPVYDDLKQIYIDKDFVFDLEQQTDVAREENPYGMATPFKKWVNMTYTEGVFPKQQNAFLAKTRQRTKYEEVSGYGSNGYDRVNHRMFWKVVSSSLEPLALTTSVGGVVNTDINLAARRLRTGVLSLNSQGSPCGLMSIPPGSISTTYPAAAVNSIWELDTNISTGSSAAGASTRPATALDIGTACVGELGWRQNSGTMGGYNATSMNTVAHHVATASCGLYRHDLYAPNSGTYTEYPVYATDIISGKQAFYNSYKDFSNDISFIGKDYSILPEFRISEHMNFYINTKDGDFLARNDAFLSLPGATVTSSALVKQVHTGDRDTLFASDTRTAGFNENFFTEYSNSDFLKYFQMIKHDHKGMGVVSAYTFKVKGIKKLLPYRGFYPHQRALQLATIFSQSFAGPERNFLFPNDIAGWNAMLRPFFNPGICFNSLKSAIGVSFPTVTGTSPQRSMGGGVSSYALGKLYGVTGSHAEDVFNFSFPFEAIITPSAFLPVSQAATSISGLNDQLLFNDEITMGVFSSPYWHNANAYASWGGNFSPLYSMAANNFFGEIPRFFLKNENLTNFVSKPQTEWKQMSPSKTYFMDIILKKTPDMVLSEGNYDRNLRGSTYGYPVSSHWADTNLSNKYLDPAYAAFTPPYFYEKSIARIAYTPTSPGTVTVDELLAAIKEPLTIELDAPLSENLAGACELSGTIYTGSFPGLSQTNIVQGGYSISDYATRSKMRISSSVNLFGKSRYKKVLYSATDIGPAGNYVPISLQDDDALGFSAWSIGTKFECPALNFSASTDFHSASTGRGLWGGYGEMPTGSQGVWLDLRESFPSRGNSFDSARTGSLIDVCGFKPTQKRIGSLASQKVISEAIVAIPFTYEKHEVGNATTLNYPNTLKKFFGIGVSTFKSVLKQVQDGTPPEDVVVGPEDSTSTSVADMIIKMQKYNFPPQYDFMTSPQLKPFVMYIFEFEHALAQQDLADIWQGLMPEISRTAEEDEVIVSHKSGPYEFFKGKQLPDTTRWMLFKVKRKAEKSYFATTSDSTDDSRFKFQFGNEEKAPEYSYNWPYDFFSLVELAKMEADIEFTPENKAFEE